MVLSYFFRNAIILTHANFTIYITVTEKPPATKNSEPLPPAKRDETLPYALFLFIGKCMEMIV